MHALQEQGGRAGLHLAGFPHIDIERPVLREIHRFEWDEDLSVESGAESSHRRDYTRIVRS